MSKIDILNRAKSIANTQGHLANSPAEMDSSGKITLCAASCIAKAAIEISGDSNSYNNFDTDVISKDKNLFVPSIFEKHGLDSALARMIMIENDSLDAKDRLNWFSNLQFT